MEHLHLSLCICTCMELADLQTHVFFLFSRLLVVLFFVFFCGVGASKPEKLWKSSILASRPGAASVSLPSHNALPAHSSSAEIGNFFFGLSFCKSSKFKDIPSLRAHPAHFHNVSYAYSSCAQVRASHSVVINQLPSP